MTILTMLFHRTWSSLLPVYLEFTVILILNQQFAHDLVDQLAIGDIANFGL